MFEYTWLEMLRLSWEGKSYFFSLILDVRFESIIFYLKTNVRVFVETARLKYIDEKSKTSRKIVGKSYY